MESDGSQGTPPEPALRALWHAPTLVLLACVAVGIGYVWLGEALWPAESRSLPAQRVAFGALPLQQQVGLLLTLVVSALIFVALPIALGKVAANILQIQQLVVVFSGVLDRIVTPKLDELLRRIPGTRDGSSELPSGGERGEVVEGGEGGASPLAGVIAAPIEPLGPPNDSYQIKVAANFVRQENHLDAIRAALAVDSDLGGAWVHGRSSVGKTSIVGVIAREFGTQRFRDGIVYVNCAKQDYTDAAAALRKVIQRFDPSRRVPGAGPENLIDLARARLRGKSALIVLDNVPLTAAPGAASGISYSDVVETLATINEQDDDRDSGHAKTDVRFVMITESVGSSADLFQPERVPGLRPEPIGYLTSELAVRLFLLSYGLPERELTEDDRRAVESIVKALDCFQLAVARLAVRVREDGWRLQDYAEELDRNPLEPIRDGAIERVCAASFDTLSRRDPHAAELLTAWYAFGVNTVGRQALEALAKGIGLENPATYLAKLEHLGFARGEVTEALSSKYDTGRWRADTERWHIDQVMLAYLTTPFQKLSEDKRHRAHVAASNHFAQYAAGAPLSALAIEEEAIMRALDWSLKSLSTDVQRCAVSMAICMGQFWRSRWDNARSQKYLPPTIKVAERIASHSSMIEDQQRKADLYFLLGRAYRHVGKLHDAETYYGRAISIFRQRKPRDYGAEATALNHLAKLSRIQGKLNDAQRLSTQAHLVASDHANPKQEGLALSELGRIARIRGQIPQAETYFKRALALLESVDETLDVGVQQGYLGRLARMQGRLEEAQEWFDKSDRSATLALDTRGHGVVLSYRARMQRTQGDIDNAKQAFTECLDIAEGVGDTGTQSSAHGYLGRMEYTRGHIEAAYKEFRASYDIARATKNGQNEAMAIGYIGRIKRAQRQQVSALWWRVRAYLKVRLVGDQRGIALSNRHLGRFMLQLGFVPLASLLADRAHAQLEAACDKRGVTTAELLQGELAARRGDLVAAHKQFTACRAAFVQLKDGGNVCACDYWLARVRDANGESARANDLYERALAEARNIGDRWNEGRILYHQGLMLKRDTATSDQGQRLIDRAKEVYLEMPASLPRDNWVRGRGRRPPLSLGAV